MNNQEVIRFVNETVRPLAETLRALRYQLDSADNVYKLSIEALLIADDKAPIEDGRELDGVSRLKSSDVLVLMNHATALLAVLNSVAPSIVSKPCVRPLEIQK